jgi:hypothetical protein
MKKLKGQDSLFFSNADVLNDMRKDVENDLKNYKDREIEKMRTSILNGMGWHGEKMNNALTISKMGQHSQTYDLSCMLLHSREPNRFIDFEKSFMLN